MRLVISGTDPEYTAAAARTAVVLALVSLPHSLQDRFHHIEGHFIPGFRVFPVEIEISDSPAQSPASVLGRLVHWYHHPAARPPCYSRDSPSPSPSPHVPTVLGRRYCYIPQARQTCRQYIFDNTLQQSQLQISTTTAKRSLSTVLSLPHFG